MGMGNSFETITVLQYRLKAAQEELAAFQSGEKYIRMEKQHLTQVRALERRIAKLEAAVAKEHSHAITIRNQWFEIFEQLQKECDRVDSQDTGGTAERNSPRQGKSIFLHPKKYSMTLTLRKHRKPLQSRKSTSA